MSDKIYCKKEDHVWDSQIDPLTYCLNCGISKRRAEEFHKIEAESQMLRLMLDADESAFTALTMNVEAHPEGYELGCLCELCRSYGD
jgi:hypothetical protein